MGTVVLHALGVRVGGAQRHLTSFLPALGRQDATRRYVVMVPETFSAPAVAENIEVRRVPDRTASGWLARTAHDVIRLPRQLVRDHVSAIVSLTNFGPVWSPVPHILFQRNPIYYCPLYLDRIGAVLAVETALRRRLALESMKRAELIVTPSDAMTALIRRYYPAMESRRFTTLYHGFSAGELDDPLAAAVSSRVSSDGRVKLLYPTHEGLHKGFDLLFSILTHLKARGVDFRLFITVGPEALADARRTSATVVRELGLEGDVVYLGSVPQQQMGALYRECDLMVYPSLCESFGFSMIEAMGSGLPIVAAQTDINEEMCRGAARYYPPLDPAAGAQAIVDALRPETRTCLLREAATRLGAFDWSWSRYAREFVAIVETVT